MPETLETFSTYLARIEKVLPEMETPIVLSTQVDIPTIRDREIEKVPIAWPLYKHNMFYIIKVPANTHVARHSHDEDVFRFIIKGSLVLNDSISINEGMWFVIRANTPYEIDTKTGYTAFGGYREHCIARLGE
jgi:hypothetical protein